MDREWLSERLASGASIEAIAREVDRDPSTVSYWARKFGLASAHAARHATRGPIARELLAEITACGLSIRDMAEVLERSPTSVRHWLDKHGLETARMARACLAALQFHHVDPRTKRFAVSQDGVSRSLAQARDEASKCVLLCANCHAEVESGAADTLVRSNVHGSPPG